ncbi:tail length tape measure protein [Mycobacterium phage Fowlmouth]|uniref:Tape measure protein n=1 Tax=Mycobacterium phage Fowlmouth TaxID=2419978 RepID=A0A3G2KG98_9CAUD|nr:tail length tape measure protein [Mycobacterium phage Fowlmouth]AYN57971.1 tape measure protein [Mycobacterium phage Fowlmouth]
MIDIGTATGKVRIEYESQGAAKVTKEFESVKKATQDAVVPFSTWADKIGLNAGALRQYNLIQKQVNEATKAARVFEQNLNNVRARSNSTLRENYRANMLQITATKSLEDLKKVAAQAQKELPMALATAGSRAAEEFSKNFEQQGILGVQKSSSKVGQVAGSALSLGLKAGVAAAAATAAAAIAGVGVAATQGFSRLERIDQANFKLKALGHSGNDVKKIMESANQAVDKTAYSLDAAATIAASAVAAGIKPGQQLTNYLTSVADAAAIAGVSLDQMGGIFNGIVATNRVYIGDLSALGNLGIPIIQALADEYGVSAAALSDMVTKGEVDSAHFLSAIQNNFGNAAKSMGDSISGAIANLKTAVARLGANFLAPLFGQTGSGDQGNSIALAVGKIRQAVDGLSNFLKSHQAGLIEFWSGFGKAALITSRVILNVISFISDSVVKITEVFGDTIGWAAQAAAGIADVFGGDGVAKNMREFADSMHALGSGLRENRDKNLPRFFNAIDSGWASILKWEEESKKAAGATDSLGDSANGAAPKVQTFMQALEELGITLQDARKGIEGSNEDFEAFLEQLADKGAPQDLIDTMKNLRQSFDQSGRGAKQFADAVQKLSDKTVSADDKANSLIDSLRTLGIIPAGEALQEYNKTLSEVTDAQANLVDVLDTTGGALIGQNGELNTSTKNGQTLFETIEKLRESMFELAASGEATPQEAWNRTHEALMLILNDFGIFGDQAEELIRKYLTDPHEFEVIYNSKNFGPVEQQLKSLFLQVESAREKGDNKIEFGLNIDEANAADLKKQIEQIGGIWRQYDPLTGTAIVEIPSNVDITAQREALERVWSQEPTKLASELNVTTKANDIVNEVVGGPGNALHIPTVLDVQNPEVVPGGTPGPSDSQGAEKNSPRPFQGPGLDPKTGQPIPLPPGPFNPESKLPDNWIVPDDLGGLLGGDGSYQLTQAQQESLVNLANNKEALDRALSENPAIAEQLKSLVDQANAQGQNMGAAFAQGIVDSGDEVRKALLQLATLAGDYLGNSPAKYGPLSGKGWTLERGKTFTRAWAQGISSESGKAKGATSSMVMASVMPFDDQFAQFIKDMQQFSDFGKHVLDFVSQVTDTVFSTLTLANDLSGGRLFPKTYVNDPDAKKSGNRLSPWSPGGTQGNSRGSGKASTGGRLTGKPGDLPANASKQQISDYIIGRAMSLGYSREQAEYFATQAYGESGFNPNASNPSGWEGIFQFDKPTWQQAGGGDMFNPQQNIDNYFRLAAQRGLTPENFTDPTQLGTQVSKGGPYHPQNAAKGHLAAAQKGVQEYIDNYSQQAVDQVAETVANNVTGAVTGSGSYGIPDVPISKGTNVVVPYGGQGFPDWVYQVADAFGLEASTYLGHQTNGANGKIASGPVAPNPQGLNRGIDWRPKGLSPTSKEGAARLDAFAKFLQGSGAAEQVIWENPSGEQFGFPFNSDFSGNYPGHRDHLHSRFSAPVTLPSGFTPGGPTPSSGTNTPVPVTISPTGQQGVIPVEPTGAFTSNLGLGLPDALNKLAENDSQFAQAVLAARGVGGGFNQDEVIPLLQHLDSMIADQNNLNTPTSKETISALETIRGGILSNYGLKEGESPLDAAQNVANGVSSIASDIFGVFDSTLKSIESAKNIGDTLVRGIGNTEDIYNIVDNVQSFIELGQRIAQTVSDVAGFASSLVGAAGSGDPSGGSSGVAMALGAVSGISGIVAQALGAVNTAIDLGQEAYRLVTKYVGRFLTSWFGFPGASDINYLLDEVTGQLQVYTSENPQMKNTFNTLGRSLGGDYGTRVGAQNSFYIYQGPGQDPRDTMTDAMFAIKSSGQGAFGYGTE